LFRPSSGDIYLIDIKFLKTKKWYKRLKNKKNLHLRFIILRHKNLLCHHWQISPSVTFDYFRVILWGIGLNWTRVHQNPWNLAIWFIIQYHKTRTFFCFGKKNFFVGFLNFWKILILHKKNRKITLLAVNKAFFNRFSWLSTFFEFNLVIFWFLLRFENFFKFSFFQG
jgi:hypothetical protein